jgi:hypothetical protein
MQFLYTYRPDVSEITGWDTFESSATYSVPAVLQEWATVPDVAVSAYGLVGSTVRLRYDARMFPTIAGGEFVALVVMRRFVRDDGKSIEPELLTSYAYGWSDEIVASAESYADPITARLTKRDRIHAEAVDTFEADGHHTYTVELLFGNFSEWMSPPDSITTTFQKLTVDSDDLSTYGIPDPSFVSDSSVAETYIDESDWHRVETLWTATENYTTVDVGLLSADIEEDVFLVDRVSLDIARLTIPAQAEILLGARAWGDFSVDAVIA